MEEEGWTALWSSAVCLETARPSTPGAPPNPWTRVDSLQIPRPRTPLGSLRKPRSRPLGAGWNLQLGLRASHRAPFTVPLVQRSIAFPPRPPAGGGRSQKPLNT
eukprot:5498390-Pyramimonas_sp.AAC.1